MASVVVCRQCGTEIADKALICFRCGEATEEAVHRPPPELSEHGRRATVPLLLGLLFFAVVLFFVGWSVSGNRVSPIVWAMLAAVGGLLALRLTRR